MNIDQDTLDVVELGVASEETQGSIIGGAEAGGLHKGVGLSDDD